MNPRQLMVALLRRLRKRLDGFLPLRSQSELCFLANLLMRMSQELHQVVDGAMTEAIGEQLLDLGDERLLRPFRVHQLVDAALAGPLPAVDPIADVEAAVRPEVAVGRQDRPDETLRVEQLEAGSLR